MYMQNRHRPLPPPFTAIITMEYFSVGNNSSFSTFSFNPNWRYNISMLSTRFPMNTNLDFSCLNQYYNR